MLLVDVLNPFSSFDVPFLLVDVVDEPVVDIDFWMSSLYSDLDVDLEDFDVHFPNDSARCWPLLSAEPVEVHLLMINPSMCEGLSERTFVEQSFLMTLPNWWLKM